MLAYLWRHKIIIILAAVGLVLLTMTLTFKAPAQPSLPASPSPLPSLPSLMPSPSLLPTLPPSSASPSAGPRQFFDNQVTETQLLYPLINWLPVDNENYHLTYSAPKVLQVTVKKGDPETIRQEILNWIRSKGIDPATHKIVFK